MSQHHKVEAVKEHFFNSHLRQVEFYKAYYEQYGYASPFQLKKFMMKNGISMKARSKVVAEKSIKIENKLNFDINLLDNYGIAESLSKEYESMRLPNHLKKIGILSDIHFPYHSLQALTIAIKHLKDSSIDCLYLNGDIMDFYSISRHEKE